LKICLPDINVLIAVTWPSHIHHGIARSWFASNTSNGWAACPFTQAGFVRISSNPAIIPDAVTPREAIAALRGLTSVGKYEFWPDDLSFAENELPTDLLVGHRQVTDAYLLGLAIRRGGTVVTLDRGVADLVSARSPHRAAIQVLSSD
jgi:uncharacterized protein